MCRSKRKCVTIVESKRTSIYCVPAFINVQSLYFSTTPLLVRAVSAVCCTYVQSYHRTGYFRGPIFSQMANRSKFHEKCLPYPHVCCTDHRISAKIHCGHYKFSKFSKINVRENDQLQVELNFLLSFLSTCYLSSTSFYLSSTPFCVPVFIQLCLAWNRERVALQLRAIDE